MDASRRVLEVVTDLSRRAPQRSSVDDELNEELLNRASDVLHVSNRLPKLLGRHRPQGDSRFGQSLLEAFLERTLRALVVVELEEHLPLAAELLPFPCHALPVHLGCGLHPAGNPALSVNAPVLDASIDLEELEVRMIRVASRTDVGPRGPGLVLVADIVDEQEVRDDTFADGPDVLPAKGAIDLLAADRRGAVPPLSG